MPETPVHKHHEALLGKDEIHRDFGRAIAPRAPLLTLHSSLLNLHFPRFPLPALDPHPLLPPPPGDAVRPQQLRQRDFGVLVAAPANPRHHFRPLLLTIRNYGDLIDTEDISPLKAALLDFAENPPEDYALAAREGVNNKKERTLRAEAVLKMFAKIVAV
jgi:hypothetical protein